MSTDTRPIPPLYMELTAKEDYRSLLNEVLAVLHRDGGQYTELAGYAVSVCDGIQNYFDLRKEVEDLRWKLKRKEGK